ncbi:MAG: 4Fe-4S binding protein [Methanothrix sp.]|nr:4Fe-4S binding protein [Methanothrix sp.]
MRKIIKIDQSLCNGCGECITSCAEGAIELVDGKARVVSDSFCDGLGACLAVCRNGALTIEEREVEEFDEKAAKEHQRGADAALTPCTLPITLKPDQRAKPDFSHEKIKPGQDSANELCGWPIQMRLVRPWAPYLQGARLLVAGDCTAFAYPAIQQDFVKGRVALVGCPKLDETAPFVDKLSEILKANEIRDITVLHMTVPCCSQLETLGSGGSATIGKGCATKKLCGGNRRQTESGIDRMEKF